MSASAEDDPQVTLEDLRARVLCVNGLLSDDASRVKRRGSVRRDARPALGNQHKRAGEATEERNACINIQGKGIWHAGAATPNVGNFRNGLGLLKLHMPLPERLNVELQGKKYCGCVVSLPAIADPRHSQSKTTYNFQPPSTLTRCAPRNNSFDLAR